jgi:3-hydroxybutyryl-CoA dehydrogenase
MQIVVVADAGIQKEMQDKQVPAGIIIKFANDLESDSNSADAYFFLLPEDRLKEHTKTIESITKPVFVNAVVSTLNQLPGNCIRINAWPGFLIKNTLEVVSSPINQPFVDNILNALDWKYTFVPDIAGMISPRTIAMIINEAYFALGDEVSTKEDIDVAMRLGTNYPHGPFEWAEIIGLQNIYSLLYNLSLSDVRYKPAPLLAQEAAI